MALIGRALVMKMDYFDMRQFMTPGILSILLSHSNMKPCFVLSLLHLLSEQRTQRKKNIGSVFITIQHALH